MAVDTRDSFDIELTIGDNFQFNFVAFNDDTTTPKDLTGFSATCEVRDKYTDDLIYTFPSVGIEGNKFILKMDSTETESLRQYLNGTNELRAVYDLQINIPAGDPEFPDGGIKSTPRNDFVIKNDTTRQ